MFKKTIIIFAALAATTVLNAQQALWDGAQVESPVLNEDGTVTFRYFAPKAVKVTVSGDFLPTQKIQTPFGEFEGRVWLNSRKGRRGYGNIPPISDQPLKCTLTTSTWMAST